MPSQRVTTKDGNEKVVVASTDAELKDAVAAVKNDQAPVAPNIDDPKDGNKIVSPDNKHTDVVGAVELAQDKRDNPEPKKDSKK